MKEHPELMSEEIIKMFNEYDYDMQLTILKYIVEEEFGFKLGEEIWNQNPPIETSKTHRLVGKMYRVSTLFKGKMCR